VSALFFGLLNVYFLVAFVLGRTVGGCYFPW